MDDETRAKIREILETMGQAAQEPRAPETEADRIATMAKLFEQKPELRESAQDAADRLAGFEPEDLLKIFAIQFEILRFGLVETFDQLYRVKVETNQALRGMQTILRKIAEAAGISCDCPECKAKGPAPEGDDVAKPAADTTGQYL